MHGIDKSLELEWFNRFGQHYSYFINEWTERHGERQDWPEALRYVLDNIQPKQTKPQKIEDKDWETEKQRVRPALWSISALE